jgi:TatD DNase family protein
MLFDTHAHYDDEQFDPDRDALLSSMPENNIGLIVNSCDSLEAIDKVLAIADKYPFIYASVGIHPHMVGSLTEPDMETVKRASTHERVVAIGEIGLDYYYDTAPRDIQRKWFSRQVELAREVHLPVIIHDRDAHKDTMDILRACHAEAVGGVLHCFSGSVEMAREVLDLGMYIAFGGSLTFKKAVRPVEVAKYVPLDRIVLETDSPYLAPEPNRGRRNSSLYMHHVAEKLAQIRQLSVEEIEHITTENAKRCFHIE